jgi:hypothetical protein
LTDLTSVILAALWRLSFLCVYRDSLFTDWSILVEPFVELERRMPNKLAVSLSGFFKGVATLFLHFFSDSHLQAK